MSILIPILSEFNAKGFKDAQKHTNILEKGLKRLAVTLGTALSVRKITQFTKASIKAFVEEDKAVQALARNLQNLGLAYDVRPIEDYIRKLQYATGIADSDLRPALQQLVGATQNLAVSQELLNLALDVSAGTGKSLASVTQALSRAYLGTNTSLSRLNVGLSKADLTAKSFNEITEELTARFSGQAARAAGTYAGQLAILSAAAGDAQEILGEKLIKSIEMLLDEKTGVVALANTFEDMATYTGDVALGLASIIKQVKTLGGLVSGGPSGRDLVQAIPVVGSYLEILAARGAKQSSAMAAKESAIARANAKEAGMLASRNYQTTRKTTTELSKQNKLKKEANDLEKKKLEAAGKMFDDELISIEAALKNESLDRNEILRLQLKKALINENATRAEELAKKLADSQAELAKLQNVKLTNPFDSWLESLQKIQEGLGRLTNPPAGSHGGSLVSPDLQGITKGTPYTPYDPGFKFEMPQWDWGATGGGILPMPTNNGVVVNMNISNLNGDLPEAVKEQIVQTVVEASGAGIATGWYRTTNRVAI